MSHVTPKSKVFQSCLCSGFQAVHHQEIRLFDAPEGLSSLIWTVFMSKIIIQTFNFSITSKLFYTHKLSTFRHIIPILTKLSILVWTKALFSSKLFLQTFAFSSHQNFPTHINFQLFHHIVPILTKLSILAWTKHTLNTTLISCLCVFQATSTTLKVKWLSQKSHYPSTYQFQLSQTRP